MNDKNYDAVIKAIPAWRPTRDCRTFGISAIQSIVKCDFKEAIALRERLEYENAIPKWKY